MTSLISALIFFSSLTASSTTFPSTFSLSILNSHLFQKKRPCCLDDKMKSPFQDLPGLHTVEHHHQLLHSPLYQPILDLCQNVAQKLLNLEHTTYGRKVPSGKEGKVCLVICRNQKGEAILLFPCKALWWVDASLKEGKQIIERFKDYKREASQKLYS